MAKLTKPQRELLARIKDEPQYVASYYPPADKLVSLGLAEWRPSRSQDLLAITEAGRATIAQKEGR